MAEAQKSSAAGNGGQLTSKEMDREIERLKGDLSTLSDHVTRLLSATGSHATRQARFQMRRARRSVDGALADAGEMGSEAADAVLEMRDSVAEAVEESVQNRPFTTLALALAVGFVAGAIWRR